MQGSVSKCKENKGCVTLWPRQYIKQYLKAKERIMKTPIYFLKETKILQDIITL